MTNAAHSVENRLFVQQPASRSLTKEPLNNVEFVGSVALTVDFADMSFQSSD
jgi:hypothetical protein